MRDSSWYGDRYRGWGGHRCLFPQQLVHYANILLKHKMLFGSDYPLITPDRWLADFEKIGIKPEVRPLILKENAIKLLGLNT